MCIAKQEKITPFVVSILNHCQTDDRLFVSVACTYLIFSCHFANFENASQNIGLFLSTSKLQNTFFLGK